MTWLPGWEVIEGNDAGTWAAGSRHPKLVLHTIEGNSIEAAVNAYRANDSWPHVTVDPRDGHRRRVQHVALNRPARALRNKSGGVQTGRAPIVIQVEIVGYAGQTHLWPTGDLDWLGSQVVAPLCDTAGIPKVTSVGFVGEGAGWILATEKARQRLSGPAWLAYEGVLGHQHVPENTHWDPGAIDISRVLSAARGIEPPSEEDDMPLSDDDLAKIDQLLLTRLKPLNDRVTRIEDEVVKPVGADGKSRMDRLADQSTETNNIVKKEKP